MSPAAWSCILQGKLRSRPPAAERQRGCTAAARLEAAAPHASQWMTCPPAGLPQSPTHGNMPHMASKHINNIWHLIRAWHTPCIQPDTPGGVRERVSPSLTPTPPLSGHAHVVVLSWSCCLNYSDVRSGTPTDSEVGDRDPMAEGDAGNFGQVRPGLQRARACEGVPVPHPLQQRRQQRVLAAQPRARTCRIDSNTNLPGTQGMPTKLKMGDSRKAHIQRGLLEQQTAHMQEFSQGVLLSVREA